MKSFWAPKLFLFLLPLTFFAIACNSGLMHQKFHYLNKISVSVCHDTDTFKKQLPNQCNTFIPISNSRCETLQKEIVVSDTSFCKLKINKNNYREFAINTKNEIKQFALKSPIHQSNNENDGKMSSKETKIWWLFGILLFVGAFVVAMAIIRYANESGSGCLFFFTFFLMIGLLTWLVLWMIL